MYDNSTVESLFNEYCNIQQYSVQYLVLAIIFGFSLPSTDVTFLIQMGTSKNAMFAAGILVLWLVLFLFSLCDSYFLCLVLDGMFDYCMFISTLIKEVLPDNGKVKQRLVLETECCTQHCCA